MKRKLHYPIFGRKESPVLPLTKWEVLGLKNTKIDVSNLDKCIVLDVELSGLGEMQDIEVKESEWYNQCKDPLTEEWVTVPSEGKKCCYKVYSRLRYITNTIQKKQLRRYKNDLEHIEKEKQRKFNPLLLWGKIESSIDGLYKDKSIKSYRAKCELVKKYFNIESFHTFGAAIYNEIEMNSEEKTRLGHFKTDYLQTVLSEIKEFHRLQNDAAIT